MAGGGRFKPPCKFFAQGTCRNGDSCRFSHDTPFGGGGNRNRNNTNNRTTTNNNNVFGGNGFGTTTNNAAAATSPTVTDATLAVAIEELRAPPIWELSGFSVTKGLPSIVHGDVSPDELHWDVVQELRATGAATATLQNFQSLRVEKQRERAYVASLLENPHSAARLFAGDALPPQQQQQQTTTTTTMSPFGQANNNAVANPFGSSGFGGAQATVTSPFGAAPASTNLFGSINNSSNSNSNSTAASSPFGNPFHANAAANAAASLSPFGTTTAAPTPTTNPFGTPATATTTGASRFGSSPLASSNNPFGGATSSPVASSFSPFGTNSTATNNSSFGSSTSPFGASPVATTATAFQTHSSFGNTTNAVQPTRFGSTAVTTTAAANPFGATTSSSTTTNRFGTVKQPATTNGVNPSPVATTAKASVAVVQPPPIPNPHDVVPDSMRDDAWNVQQFDAPAFARGMVPTEPPPLHLCR